MNDIPASPSSLPDSPIASDNLAFVSSKNLVPVPKIKVLLSPFFILRAYASATPFISFEPRLPPNENTTKLSSSIPKLFLDSDLSRFMNSALTGFPV